MSNQKQYRRPVKVTYIPDKVDVETLFKETIPAGENFEDFDDIPVQVSANRKIPHLKKIADAKFPAILESNFRKSGYSKLTPIQKYAIPYIMNKEDVLACAQTGSGKTAVYLLPIISSIIKQKENNRKICVPVALVIVPTRELAIQIEHQALKFAYKSGIKVCNVYGGVSVKHHLNELKGCEIIIGTPGRLHSFIIDGIAKIDLSNLQFVVLDEADRLLEHFLADIEDILKSELMPPKEERQTIMVSATFQKDTQEQSHTYIREGHPFIKHGDIGAANQDIKQTILSVTSNKKTKELCKLLDKDYSANGEENDNTVPYKQKTLVFAELIKTVDRLAEVLEEKATYSFGIIHRKCEQEDREKTLKDFREGKIAILIATSVAARGLDIVNVDHVIQYDLPKGPAYLSHIVDVYVQRIGRTGRAGNRGRATAFFDQRAGEEKYGLDKKLVKVLSDAQQEIPDWLAERTGILKGGGWSQEALKKLKIAANKPAGNEDSDDDW